jgi:hypothetical protein
MVGLLGSWPRGTPYSPAAVGFCVLVLIALPALATAKTVPAQDFWCLERGNLERVVNAAAILDLGAPGPDPRQVTPNGSNDAIAVSVWRQSHPDAFRIACDGAYRSHYPDAFSRSDAESIKEAIEDTGSGPSDEEKEGLALLGGVLAALAGAGAAYGFGNRRRNKDIEYANALLLGNALLLLTSDLEELAVNAEAGAVGAEDKGLTRRRTAELTGRIPAGRLPKSVESTRGALTALRDLDKVLKAPPLSDPKKEAVRLRRAKKDVTDKVGALVADLSRKAADSMSFRNGNAFGETGTQERPNVEDGHEQRADN